MKTASEAVAGAATRASAPNIQTIAVGRPHRGAWGAAAGAANASVSAHAIIVERARASIAPPPGVEPEEEDASEETIALGKEGPPEREASAEEEEEPQGRRGQEREDEEDELAAADAEKREQEVRDEERRQRDYVDYDNWYPKIKASPKMRRERHEVEELQDQILEETKSEGLAKMLGGLKLDLYTLTEQVEMLNTDIHEGVKLKKPNLSHSMVYPVSVCMQCILMLTAQYFIVYTALAVCKVFTEKFHLGSGTVVELSLLAACDTLFYAPMLCVLFLGSHLRALQISQGESGPPAAAELGMQACSGSILMQTLLMFAIPVLSGEAPDVGGRGEVKMQGIESRALAGILTVIRYAAMVAMYLGFTMVCIMSIFMDTYSLNVEPVDLWDDPTTVSTETAPPISAAMKCTMLLTVLFFAAHLVHAILHSCVNLSGGFHSDPFEGAARSFVLRWERTMQSVTFAVNLAPMVCILFMSARMQAQQADPKKGQPPSWSEQCFYICTTSIVVHALIVLTAEVFGIDSKVSPHSEGSITRGTSGMEINSPRGVSTLQEIDESMGSVAERVVVCLRALPLLAIYSSCLGCVLGLLQSQAEIPTQALSPTMRCVIVLTAFYFAVDMGLFLSQSTAIFFIMTSCAQRTRESCGRFIRTFKMAEYTVKFCPMLAILCIGARMRALHMSHQKGSPQCWAQDAMYTATAGVGVQLLVMLFAGMLTRNVGVDEGGSPTSKELTYVPGKVLLEAIRVGSFIALYGGIVLVGASVITIRPDTAKCPG